MVFECIPGGIRQSRGDDGHPVQGTVLLHAIDDLFPRCSFQSLLVRAADGFDRAGEERHVPSEEGSIIGSIVVISSHDIVEAVDRIGAGDVLFSQMGSPVGCFCFPFKDLERSMGLIPWKAGS